MGKNKKHYNPPKVEETKKEEVKTEEITIVDAEVYGVQSMLNIRSTPEVTEGNVVATLTNGAKVKVEEPEKETNGFYKIIIFDQEKKPKKAYAMKKYIKIV